MAKNGGVSCLLCLRADDLESVLRVEIPHHAILEKAIAPICRDCAAAIARAAELAGEPLPEVKTDEPETADRGDSISSPDRRTDRVPVRSNPVSADDPRAPKEELGRRSKD